MKVATEIHYLQTRFCFKSAPPTALVEETAILVSPTKEIGNSSDLIARTDSVFFVAPIQIQLSTTTQNMRNVMLTIDRILCDRFIVNVVHVATLMATVEAVVNVVAALAALRLAPAARATLKSIMFFHDFSLSNQSPSALTPEKSGASAVCLFTVLEWREDVLLDELLARNRH